MRNRENNRRWMREYREYNPEKRMIWAAKKRAKEKGLEFNITEEDIVIPECCPYLGITFSYHVPRGQSRDTIASLDRIDPAKGYVKGNIRVISHLANTMKNKATEEMLVHFAKQVLKLHDSHS